MSSENDAGTWDRVAAELRACKEAQQRAWGDIDNAILGRYLAGDLSGDERRRVESDLEKLPELRKLVDLVGDVLNEFEPAAAPAPAVPEPVVLSFKARSSRRSLGSFLRQRSVVAAAACLLLTLGLVASLRFVPLPTSDPGTFAQVSTPTDPPAGDSGFARAGLRSSPPPPRAESFPPGVPVTVVSNRELAALAVAEGSAEDLEKKGQVREARQLVEKTAATVNQIAMQLQKDGDLVGAEPLWSNTHELCKRKLGPDHPETQCAGRNLVLTYQVAVNTPPTDGKAAYPFNPPKAPAGIPTARAQVPYPGEKGYLPPAAAVSAKTVVADSALGREAKVAQAADTLRDKLERRDPRQLKTRVVPLLTEALKRAASPQEREALARTLGHLGPTARQAVPVLTAYLRKSNEPREQQAILIALGQMGPAARDAAPVLVEWLSNADTAARLYAAEAIVRLGPAARGALPALNKRAEAKDAVVQDVLRRIEGHEGRIGICDECDCFSVQALGESLRQIHTLAESSGVEVLVETAPTLAADRKADERAREIGVRGVCILLAHDAPAVQVSVSPALQKQGLTADRVRAAVEPCLKENNFDKALVEAVAEVARFEKARPDRKSP